MDEYDVAVIGGGPAGSSAALHLRREGFSVCVLEKCAFPRETVCGEFLSTEVARILKSLGLFDDFLRLSPNPLSRFEIFHNAQTAAVADLPLPVFGLQRSVFDHFLLQRARIAGASILQPADVVAVARDRSGFKVTHQTAGLRSELFARSVVGAYGRWDPIDRELRGTGNDIHARFSAIKIHVAADVFRSPPGNTVSLFGGKRMYCGINAVDQHMVTVSMLEERSGHTLSPRQRLIDCIRENDVLQDLLGKGGTAAVMEGKIYGTGRVEFGPRKLVSNGVYMVGDAARVIPPLVGDGIAMAMESGRIVADLFGDRRRGGMSDAETEERFARSWARSFRRRVAVANVLQHVVMGDRLREFGLRVAGRHPWILSDIISATRDVAS